MPLIQESHDSLPFIDEQVTEPQRDHIHRLISSQLPPEAKTTLHPLIPPEIRSKLSPLMEQELERRAAGMPITGGIDLSRYEAPEAPSDTDDIDAWRTALFRAYTSSTYLSGRMSNLSLLEELGKNAWLIGNSQLEEILRQSEKDLEHIKIATEDVNRSRKAAQIGAHGEMTGLEETWKRTIGQILEVEVATEEMRQNILATRRRQAD